MKRNDILTRIKMMAEDNNQGLIMTTNLVDIRNDPRGSIVGFGVERKLSDDIEIQLIGLPGKYMCCAFFIDREELKNYK